MIKKIGKQPLKANVHDLGSFMYKNSGSLDKINELIYGIGNYINAYDVQKHMNNSLAGQLGVGYDYNIHPVVFSPTVGRGIQYMKPEGYVEEGEEENQKSIYDEAQLSAQGSANTTTQPTITPLLTAVALWGFLTPNAYNPHRAEKSFGGPVYDVGGALNAGAGALKLGTDALNNWGSKSQIKGMQGVYQGISGLANTRFAGSNENLLEQDLATLHYNPGTYRDLMTTSSGFGVGDGLQAIGAGMEGAKAGSGFGGIGAAAGAIFGTASSIISTLLGKHRQKKRARREIAIANALGRAANAARDENFEDAAEGNDKGQGLNALFNYGSMNAGLGTSYQGALGGRLFDEGGFMGNHGTVWDTGLNYFKTGGTHEENPNGGILQGYDSQGTPNLVEEGEYKWTDDKYGFGEYIFSNRLMVPQEVANKYKLGGTAKKAVTFAQGIQKYLKDNGVEDMENDPIQQDTTGEFLATMATIQEQVRIQEQIKQFIEELKKMPPEQQRQALALLQQLAIQQQLQAMQEQQAMQLVEQQQQAMQQPMEQGQELMPQEIPQEAPQEQMVQDSGQPMMEQQGQTQVAPQAYGGRIFAEGGNTMMENQGYEKLTDEDKEAIENQKRQQMQEDATRAQKQEEESEEERLDDQIDQIIEYAKETYNKELLVGARKAQRGNIEEKKAFIDRASQIMETERQQQQQTAAQQDQQQNAEMQARLQQEAQQPLPGEVPQEDMGINAMAYGGKMNTFAKGGSPGPGDEFNEWALSIYPTINWTEAPSDTDRFKYNLIRKALELIYSDINNNRGNTVRGAFNDTRFLKTFKNSPLGLLAEKKLLNKKLEDITPQEWEKLIDTYYDELKRFNAQWKKAYGENSVPPPYFERYTKNYRTGTEKAYNTVLTREEEDGVKSDASSINGNQTLEAVDSNPIQPIQPINNHSQEIPPAQLNTPTDKESILKKAEEIYLGLLDKYKDSPEALQHIQSYKSLFDSYPETAEVYQRALERQIESNKQDLSDSEDTAAKAYAGDHLRTVERYAKEALNPEGTIKETPVVVPTPEEISEEPTEEINSNKLPVRTLKEAQRLLLKAYGRRGYDELTDRQKDMLMEYVMYADGDLKNTTADQYDHVLGREIIDPTNLLVDAPKVTMYNALENDDARKAFNENLDGYVAPGTVEWLAKEFEDQEELTDFYRSTLWDWWNKYNGRTDAGKWPGRDDTSGLSKQFADFAFDYKTAMDFYNSLDSNDPKQARLKDLISKQWIDKSTGKLADWTGKTPWEYLNRYTKNDPRWTREGTVYENPAYKAWVDQEPVDSDYIQGRRIDTKHGEDHYPSGNAPRGGVEIQYYLNDINNADNRLGIDPTQDIYSNYYTVDADPIRVTSDDGSLEIWKYLVTPKATKNYVKVTYDKKGNPVYRRGTQEEMQSDGYVPYNDVPDNYKKVSNPSLPGYQMENVFYTPKLGEKGSNDKILEGIEGILNGINLQELPQFLYQLSHPANQSYYNMALRQWDRVPMMATDHLGNYVAPQYVDINSMNNKAMSMGLQGIQAAQNISNGNVGSLNYNTQLANYMMQQGLADNLIKGTQWNAEQQQKAAAHNTEKVDTPNIANDLAVAKQNQDAMIARAQAYPAIADKMTENEASWHQGIALGIGRIANGNDLLLSNSEYRKIINALIKDLGLA